MQPANESLTTRERWMLSGLVIGAALFLLGFLVGKYLGGV